MEKQITIREAITKQEIERFWEQLHTYHKRDIFPDPEDEERAYFLAAEYCEQVQRIHDRETDRCYFLFFYRDGQEIGFAMPVIFASEDGKCFIMEFCVYPEFRGNGMGTACAEALLAWAKERSALYAELNFGGDERRRRFWRRIGFVDNGADEWNEPLMLLPPEEEIPFTVEILADPEDWQLKKLENGYRREICEDPLTEEQYELLSAAVREEKITFFIVRRGYRAVGMCSVVKSFSTFSCCDTAVFEDFYAEPAFRKRGIARLLAEKAQEWCKENKIASITVCCASCDEAMYRALGFDVCLGTTFAKIL